MACCSKSMTTQPTRSLVRRHIVSPGETIRLGTVAPAPELSSGPGTELKAIFRSLGLPTCGPCHAWASLMDQNGVRWCRDNKQLIVARLREARDEATWFQKRRAEVLAIATGLAFHLDPLDPLGSVVDEAIRRAEAA